MPLTHPLLSEERPGILRFGGARMMLLDVESSFWGLRRQLEALVGRRLTDAVLQQAGTNSGNSFARAFIGPDAAGDAQALRDCVAAYQAAGFGRFEIEFLEWPIGRALIRGTDTFESWMVRQHGQKVDAPACAYTSGVLVGFVNTLSGRRDVVCVKRACQAQGAKACLFELLPADRASGTLIIAFDPDPFLSHQLNLLEILFDRMPMGIAILDQDLVLRRCNPTWASFIDRYTPSTTSRVAPGVCLLDLVPGIETTTDPIFERVLAGETVRREALRLESGNIVSYWNVVFTPLIEDDRVVGLVDVMTDATEGVLAYQTLEQRVEERTHEIEQRRQVAEGLRDILTVLNSNRPLNEILDYIVAQAGRLLGTDAVAIYRRQGKDGPLSVQAARGLPADYVADARIPVGQGAVGQAALKRQPVAVSDVTVVLPNDDDLMPAAPQHAHRACLAVPLIVKDKVYGGIVLYYPEPREFSVEEIALAVAFGDQAALAIENARLRAQAEQAAVAAERSRLARDLHDAVTQTLYSASLIAEVLPRLWERNPDQVRRSLEDLRQLTRGALAEMRTLLLELRPEALTKVPLGDLLRQLTEAITTRTGMPVTLTVEREGSLPSDMRVALYRIAQEALNNVARHAGASQVAVSLRCQPEEVKMLVSDDGHGFNTEDISPEHLGLGIMRERAEAIGARLKIESQIGHGTQVVVVWAGDE